MTYGAGTTRTLMLPINLAAPQGYAPGFVGWSVRTSDDILQAAAGSSYTRIPFPPLPTGAVISTVEVVHDQQTSAPPTFAVRRRSGVNFTTPAGGSQASIVSVTANATTGVKKETLTVSHTVANVGYICTASRARRTIRSWALA